MPDYARSAEVYRELRGALGPWCKENGYRRRRGSELGWVRGLTKTRDLSFWFSVGAWGSGATGGSSFHGTLQVAPSEASGVVPDSPNMRQCDVSLCLAENELDELREVQNAINRRRPRTPELEAWMREDSGVGEHTRDQYRQYARGEKPYRVGDFVTFGYYTIADVRFHTGFLARYLPQIVARFVDERCAQPTFFSG